MLCHRIKYGAVWGQVDDFQITQNVPEHGWYDSQLMELLMQKRQTLSYVRYHLSRSQALFWSRALCPLNVYVESCVRRPNTDVKEVSL